MAEAKSQGKGVTKRVGPLPVWGYAAVGVGAFLLYRILGSRSSSGASTIPLTGGTTIPPGTASGTNLPTFSSLAQWQQAAISAMSGAQLSPADALNGLTSWFNGQCVSAAQYSGISSIIETVGLPPGFSQVPTLSVCPTTTGTQGGTPPTSTTPTPTPTPTPTGPGAPPNLASSLIAAMTTNGEHLVGAPVFDTATNTWLYLTQKGGVYALNPNGTPSSAFYGSGLSASLGNAFAGRTAQSLTANPDGSYTITDTAGENYTFGAPGQGRDYAGTTVA